jgi:hypothetical protein
MRTSYLSCGLIQLEPSRLYFYELRKAHHNKYRQEALRARVLGINWFLERNQVPCIS